MKDIFKKSKYYLLAFAASLAMMAVPAQALDLSQTITQGTSFTSGKTFQKVTGDVTIKEFAVAYSEVDAQKVGGCGEHCGTSNTASVKYLKNKTTTVNLDQITKTATSGSTEFCDTSISVGAMTIGGKSSSGWEDKVAKTKVNNLTEVRGYESERANYYASGGDWLGKSYTKTSYNQDIYETGNTTTTSHTHTSTSGSYLN